MLLWGLQRLCRVRKERRVAPNGCFWVYVGSERELFAVRVGRANHPLFRALLAEAESECGFFTNGPLELPCDVGLFHRILRQIEADGDAKVATDGHHRRQRYGPPAAQLLHVQSPTDIKPLLKMRRVPSVEGSHLRLGTAVHSLGEWHRWLPTSMMCSMKSQTSSLS